MPAQLLCGYFCVAQHPHPQAWEEPWGRPVDGIPPDPGQHCQHWPPEVCRGQGSARESQSRPALRAGYKVAGL